MSTVLIYVPFPNMSIFFYHRYRRLFSFSGIKIIIVKNVNKVASFFDRFCNGPVFNIVTTFFFSVL